MPKMTPEELEKFIHRELRGLPERAAPHTLESRVLTALEQRTNVAWYHQSWSYWPATARAAFLALATGIAGSAIVAFYQLSQGAAVHEIGTAFGWIPRLVSVGTWVANFTYQMISDIPSLWFYGGLAFIAVMYVTFVGLGTAAYRYLYRSNN